MDVDDNKDISRLIAHVDMDAFYASVESRDDPSLAGKPVVVGGGKDSRGVVSAASYAARVFGVHSAMPMARAVRMCPDLVCLPVNMGKYQAVSREIMEILGRYSPTVQPLSLDEAFLDLSGMELALGPGPEIGVRIKRDILEELRLTASVGIAPVKFVAKIASDLEKPDGLVVVERGCVREFLRPLPIARLWGVGPKTRESLEAMGIRTIGQIARTDLDYLRSKFGLHGEHLHDLALGRDSRAVIANWDAKSYSHEQTFAKDQIGRELLHSLLLDQSVRVARRLRRDGVAGKVIQIKLRYSDFSTITRQQSMHGPTADPDRIYEVSRTLFDENWNGSPVRLLGVGASSIQYEGVHNLELFDPAEAQDKRRRLTETLDQIEDRFGRGKVVRAKTLRKRGLRGTGSPSDRGFDEDPPS